MEKVLAGGNAQAGWTLVNDSNVLTNGTSLSLEWRRDGTVVGSAIPPGPSITDGVYQQAVAVPVAATPGTLVLMLSGSVGGTAFAQVVDKVEVVTQTTEQTITAINDIKTVTDAIPDSGAMTSIAQEATVAAVQAVTDNLPESGQLTTINTNAQTAATQAGTARTVTDKIDSMLEADGANFRFTAAGLAQSPSGSGGASAAQIADAIMDEARAGHTTAGTLGETIAFLHAAFESSGVLSTAALANGPSGGGGGSVTLSASERNEIAKAVMILPSTQFEDDAPKYSLGTMVMMPQRHTISGTDLTVQKANGDTMHTFVVTTSSSAEAITGVA